MFWIDGYHMSACPSAVLADGTLLMGGKIAVRAVTFLVSKLLRLPRTQRVVRPLRNYTRAILWRQWLEFKVRLRK